MDPPPPHSYLQDPVVGAEPGAVGRPVGADHVDVDAFLQEAVRHAEAEVVDLGVLHHRHLHREGPVTWLPGLLCHQPSYLVTWLPGS